MHFYLTRNATRCITIEYRSDAAQRKGLIMTNEKYAIEDITEIARDITAKRGQSVIGAQRLRYVDAYTRWEFAVEEIGYEKARDVLINA